MNYKIFHFSHDHLPTDARSVLIIYTGGTFGMVYDDSGSLVPFNFGLILEKVPELKTLGIRLTVISFPQPIDSSNIQPQHWQDMGFIVSQNYDQYDGFVILHGTDTMAYSASALSFMLQGLAKPVIFTGAQLPVGLARSDARENLITALEIARAHIGKQSKVSEVCVYFDSRLLRGNRAKKVKSAEFSAFSSGNFPPLARVGIHIDYSDHRLLPPGKKLKYSDKFDRRVFVLTVHPGLTKETLDAMLDIPNIKGIVMLSFGSGNVSTESWFIDGLKNVIKKGVIVLNVSQCMKGKVLQGRYETSKTLNEIGVIGGSDITLECAVVKLMFTLGNYNDANKVKNKLQTAICGEMSL